MARGSQFRRLGRRLIGGGARIANAEDGAQLVELSLALPILFLFLLGIVSFGGAFEQRNQMAIAAREGARLAAGESTLDLYAGGTPPSIQSIRDVVQASLAGNNLKCALDTGSNSGTLQWTYTSSACANVSLVINRGYTALSADGVTQLEGTQLQLSYPYTWSFARFFGPLVMLPAAISVQATMMNAP